jgi:hypothetical protein
MNMPGFTAEAVLANPKEPYRVVRRSSNRADRASVIPAIPVMPGEFCDNMAHVCNMGHQYGCIIWKGLCDSRHWA